MGRGDNPGTDHEIDGERLMREPEHIISVRDRLDGRELAEMDHPHEASSWLDGITRLAMMLAFNLGAYLNTKGFDLRDFHVDVEITLVPKGGG
jgi:hypothetical protein